MNTSNTGLRRLIIIGAVALALTATVVFSQGGYELAISTFTGGGGDSTGAGGYSVNGTIGQSMASVSAGGPFTLSGGSWSADWVIYLPTVVR